MREIEFRVWDFNKKVFIPNNLWAFISTDFGAFGYMLEDWEDYKKGEFFYSDSQDLQQYTGLKDKKGKKIFEGDVIFCTNTGNDYLDSMPLIVRYGSGTFYASCKNRFIFRIPETVEYWEVLGNVYENPELINEVKK